MTNPDTREALADELDTLISTAEDSRYSAIAIGMRVRNILPVYKQVAAALRAPLPGRTDCGEVIERFMEVVRSRWNFEEHQFDCIEHVLSDPECVAALSIPRAVDGGAVAERETWWLIERPGPVYASSRGWRPNWSLDPWRAERYLTAREADEARLSLAVDEYRNASTVVEHMFINKTPRPLPRVSTGGAAGEPVAWQPIETAPIDGSTVLAVKMDAPEPDVCVAHFRKGKWVCMTAEDWDAGEPEWRDHAWYFVPTHWQPRPALPRSESGGAA